MTVYVVSGYDLNWKTFYTPKVFKNKTDAEKYLEKHKEDFLIVYDLDEVVIEEEFDEISTSF